jgi:hypothetical protein
MSWISIVMAVSLRSGMLSGSRQRVGKARPSKVL